MNYEELLTLGAAGDIDILEEPKTMIKDSGQLWEFIRQNRKKEEYTKKVIRRATRRRK